jgi:hypothetical protein
MPMAIFTLDTINNSNTMKNYLHLLFISCLFFASCAEKTIEVATQVPNTPQWVQDKMSEPLTQSAEDITLAEIDFLCPENPLQVAVLAADIRECMTAIGRAIPSDVCESLARGDLDSASLELIREQYFYSEDRTGSSDMVRTRTVLSGTQYNYSTTGIYFYILTHLGTYLIEGSSTAINYFTLGISVDRLTFADANKAGRALYNSTSNSLVDFDPNLSDFHYGEDTNPVYYSSWAFEMVYPDNVVVNGVTYTGPFGNQEGTNLNYAYQFITPFNEEFVDLGNGELFPFFPVYDALWYFPVPNLGAVYILGTDL